MTILRGWIDDSQVNLSIRKARLGNREKRGVLEYILFIGLVIAFWYFYSKNPKPWKDFASKLKAQLGAMETSKSTTQHSNKGKRKKPSQSKGSQKGLTFEREKKLPEVDSAGRVIVSLAAGSQLEFEVRVRSDEATRYLLGKPKDDEVVRSVRARVLIHSENKSVEVTTPDGKEIGEVLLSESKKATEVFSAIEVGLKKLSKGLIGKQLVFDVSLKVEGEWQSDSEEESGWFGDVSSAFIRIKDPAGIDIL